MSGMLLFIISAAGKRLIVDLMLASKGTNPPIPLTKNLVKNPLIDLSFPFNMFGKIDGVLLTHIHTDHFDKAARQYLLKNIPIMCQSSDVKKLQPFGFSQVISIQNEYNRDNGIICESSQ